LIEAGLVNTGADQGCEPGRDVIDLATQILGVEVYGTDLLVLHQAVERVREPLQHFHAFVVDDAVGLLVPKERDTVLACVGWVIAKVELVHEAAVEEVVERGIRIAFVEAPSRFTFGIRSDYRDG
jgi:hypothetical protein